MEKFFEKWEGTTTDRRILEHGFTILLSSHCKPAVQVSKMKRGSGFFFFF